MADHYTHLSIAFPASDEEFQFLCDVNRAIEAAYYATDQDSDLLPDAVALGRELFKATDNALGCHIERQGNDVWIWDYCGSPNLEALAGLLQGMLKHSNREGVIVCKWAETCSKPRLDAYGGGAFIVSKDGTIWIALDSMIEEEVHDLSTDVLNWHRPA